MGDTELGDVTSLEDREALQRDLDKSEGWVITNHTKSNKSKCQILHVGQATLEDEAGKQSSGKGSEDSD